MRLMQRLERVLRPFAIPNLALYLIAGQAIGWLLLQNQPELAANLRLIPSRVLQGEVWRLFSFLLDPPTSQPIFLFFAFYMFWLMSNALEHQWGTVRFNLYLLVGYLVTIASSFIVPGGHATNSFLAGSVFLAFADLFPNFVIYIFFILPVRIKWLALLAWIGYGYVLVMGAPMERIMVLAAIANFLLFFWRDIRDRIRRGRHRMKQQTRQIKSRAVEKDAAFHTCALCGITDRTHPTMEFRYCTECQPTRCFCAAHLAGHPHQRPRAILGLK